MEESNLSIFKIGVGPSSSHTVGPIVAGNDFAKSCKEIISKIEKIQINLYGSLSLTGRGHLTDKACILGLSAISASIITPKLKSEVLSLALEGKKLNLNGEKIINFDYAKDVIFHKEFLPLHENGLEFIAFDATKAVLKSQIYYSIGGGFIAKAEELQNKGEQKDTKSDLKYNFNTAKELLELCNKHNKSIAQISMARECELNSAEYVREYCLNVYHVMVECMKSGMNNKEEIIEGGINLRRRAPALAKKLKNNPPKDPLGIMDYISLYALAISEENASGGKVVTSPTNGACGVIPAVLEFINKHIKPLNENEIVDFLLTAMAIGSLYKKNASISGAEAGCQAEIGSASSMAAVAGALILGASNEVAASAGEIAMEHHLGLTCDPVEGLVQIPCIERNIFGAIKAISAIRVAMSRDSAPTIALDEIIYTMYHTGKDMDIRYKETSLGGLASTYKKDFC